MSLKKFYDATNVAEAQVQSIASQINDLFELGKTDEALALRPQLDQAQAAAHEAHQLYISMQAASLPQEGSDPARMMVPSGENVQVNLDEGDQKFENIGKYFMAVKHAALYPGRADPRLRGLWVRDATGMSEGVPAEGGYLLPSEGSSTIMERMYAIGEILKRVMRDPVSGNSMTYNAIDESSRVAGSRWGGVRGYWIAEAGSIPTSKPTFRPIELKLKKVAALCYATDEQLEDTANLASWLSRIVPEELRFQVEDAIIEGDGLGKPLGIMNSPCLVAVTRDTASHIYAADIMNMWARRWIGVKDYVWLVSPDAEAQLPQMTIGDMPVYLPPGGFTGALYGTMLGCPVIPVEYCQALNTSGDIILASLSQYQTIDKDGAGVASASSIHVAFTTDETAFRFTYRIDGEPTWDSALTPLHGSSTVSPFVVLGSASA